MAKTTYISVADFKDKLTINTTAEHGVTGNLFLNPKAYKIEGNKLTVGGNTLRIYNSFLLFTKEDCIKPVTIPSNNKFEAVITKKSICSPGDTVYEFHEDGTYVRKNIFCGKTTESEKGVYVRDGELISIKDSWSGYKAIGGILYSGSLYVTLSYINANSAERNILDKLIVECDAIPVQINPPHQAPTRSIETHPKKMMEVTCPYCGSLKTERISALNRDISVTVFGLGSSKIGKQWHCKNCKSDF